MYVLTRQLHDSGILSLKNQRPKYQITHPSGKIAETANVRLRLHYSVQPWVGLLTWNQYNRDFGLWKTLSGGVSASRTLPPVKKSDDKKKKSS